MTAPVVVVEQVTEEVTTPERVNYGWWGVGMSVSPATKEMVTRTVKTPTILVVDQSRDTDITITKVLEGDVYQIQVDKYVPNLGKLTDSFVCEITKSDLSRLFA